MSLRQDALLVLGGGPMSTASQTIKWLRRAAVVLAMGAIGIVLKPAADLTPATPAEKRAALAKMRCRGEVCSALLLAPAGQCAALTGAEGVDPTMTGSSDCPGDNGFAVGGVSAGQRLRRLLACGVRDGALTAWHAEYPPGQASGQCGVSLLLSRGQVRGWVERLDASTSTALVSTRLADMPAVLKRNGGRWHTWAGTAPDDDTDDAADAGLIDETTDGGP